MRNRSAVYRYRAAFGFGFLVLGAVTLYRIAVVDAPVGNKILGGMLALAMLALGVVRIVQYARLRRDSGR